MKVLLLALVLAVLAFINVGNASAAEWHVYPGQSIQTAINNADIDDTIYVHAGTYVENVNVNKRLTLIGVDKPVVWGATGPGIILTSDGIMLEGFTARGLVSPPIYYTGIGVSSNNNILINNTASNSGDGIYLFRSSNNILIGNIVTQNYRFGIRILGSNNILTGNIASSNDENGIYSDGYSSSNTLTNNTVYNNGDEGICFFLASDNTLTGNTANSNTIGIYLAESSNITLSNNTANSNNGDGIYLDLSNDNTLTGNTANSNKNYGIVLGYSSNNTLTDNTANSNKNYGVALYASGANHIYNNYFDNTNNAYDDGTNIWNITKTPGKNIVGGSYLGGNYWSDYSGEDLDGDGIGDTMLPYNSSGGIQNGRDWLPLVEPYHRWDINEDGITNYLDAAFIGIHYGETTTEPYPRYDINEDGVVNYLDAAFIGIHYGEVTT